MADGGSQDDFDEAPDRAASLRTHFALAVTSLLEGDERPSQLPVTPAFAQHLTELSHSWVTTALAPDLEAFMRHSKRSTVGPEDVVLAARKNDTTRKLVEAEAARSSKPRKKGKEAEAEAAEAAS